MVWVKCRGITCRIESIWAMKISCSERNRRRVLNLYVKMVWRREYAIERGGVGQSVSAPISDLYPLLILSGAYRTTSPTLTDPTWCTSSIFRACLTKFGDTRQPIAGKYR